MNFRILLAALLLVPALARADGDSCTVPGVLVLEDPAGDHGLKPGLPVNAPVPAPVPAIPLPVGDWDFISLQMAEPNPDTVVFTYKVSELGTVPPQTGWIVRFATDEAPGGGDEDFFVAMISDENQATQFVYGTDGFQYGLPAAEPRQFHVQGTLDGSSMDADGTIRLVLPKSAVPGINTGSQIYNILPTVRLITPAYDSAGFFTNADNSTILDDTVESGIYDVVGDCSGDTKVLGISLGGLPLGSLVVLGFAALLRRRQPGI